jgi:hypothetical protein
MGVASARRDTDANPRVTKDARTRPDRRGARGTAVAVRIIAERVEVSRPGPAANRDRLDVADDLNRRITAGLE